MEDCVELWRVERVVLLLLMLAERLAWAILALGEVGSHLRAVNSHSPTPISKMRWSWQSSVMFYLVHIIILKIQSVHIKIKIQIYSFISFKNINTLA